jgi:hypothetical protein
MLQALIQNYGEQDKHQMEQQGILEFLKKQNGRSKAVGTVASMIGIPESLAVIHLSSLQERGLVQSLGGDRVALTKTVHKSNDEDSNQLRMVHLSVGSNEKGEEITEERNVTSENIESVNVGDQLNFCCDTSDENDEVAGSGESGSKSRNGSKNGNRKYRNYNGCVNTRKKHKSSLSLMRQVGRGVWSESNKMSRVKKLVASFGYNVDTKNMEDCEVLRGLFQFLLPDPDNPILFQIDPKYYPMAAGLLIDEHINGKTNWFPSAKGAQLALYKALSFFCQASKTRKAIKRGEPLLESPWWISSYLTAINILTDILICMSKRANSAPFVNTRKKLAKILESKGAPPGAWILGHVLIAICHTKKTSFAVDIHVILINLLRFLKDHLGHDVYLELLQRNDSESHRARESLMCISYSNSPELFIFNNDA